MPGLLERKESQNSKAGNARLVSALRAEFEAEQNQARYGFAWLWLKLISAHLFYRDVFKQVNRLYFTI